ncbi:hypothetical protein, partial [Klebsiella grimontii]|uniref:hypothetical protein n=1 Tax=Klebsiella grimontii TaxID=2058152 RepID=UPI0031B69BFF
MHHILHTFSNEGVDEVAVLAASTREDNVALATARRASRKASHPPGCTILLDTALAAISKSAVK